MGYIVFFDDFIIAVSNRIISLTSSLNELNLSFVINSPSSSNSSQYCVSSASFNEMLSL